MLAAEGAHTVVLPLNFDVLHHGIQRVEVGHRFVDCLRLFDECALFVELVERRLCRGLGAEQRRRHHSTRTSSHPVPRRHVEAEYTYSA